MRFYDILLAKKITKKTTWGGVDKRFASQYSDLFGSGNKNINFTPVETTTSSTQIINLKFDEKNPYALGIKFNIQAFYDSSTYTPSTLTIINPPTAFYSQSQGLLGMDIKVEAGIKPSVFTSKLELTASTNNILFIGKVARVVPQWGGLNPSVTFLLSSVMSDSTGDNSSHICIIEKGEKIADSLTNTLREMLPDISVEIVDSAIDMTLQDNQTMQREVKSYMDLVNLAKQLGIGFAVDKNRVIMYGIKKGYENSVSPFEPKPQDFLSQPEFQNHSTIQCVFGLRGDLQLTQKVKMPKNTVLSSGGLTGGSGGGVSQTGSLAGVSNANAIIASDDYKITGIWHTGDSRNSSALAWATTISATSTKNLANK